jgi:hypothetical protein
MVGNFNTFLLFLMKERKEFYGFSRIFYTSLELVHFNGFWALAIILIQNKLRKLESYRADG